MSAFEDHKDELQHYEQMLGAHRGRLAVTLDRVTNAMVLVGQHGVYCHSQRDPTKPTMDIQIITDELRKAKELIQSVMEELASGEGESAAGELIGICGTGFSLWGFVFAMTKPHRLKSVLLGAAYFPARNGFVARSLPIVVASPCPG